MTSGIKDFIGYLRDVRRASRNTEIPYQRDPAQLATYLEDKRVTEVIRVTRASLNSYILFLKKKGKATTTVSREPTSTKAFFSYPLGKDMIRRDPAELLKAPRIKKEAPAILSVDEVNALLKQPEIASVKEICGGIILELLYATRIRISKLIGLGLKNPDMQMGYITYRDGQKGHTVPFGENIRQATVVYLEQGRKGPLEENESEQFFINCSGKAMSRQGFWEIIEYRGEKTGIEVDVTSRVLCHSLAAHLIHRGADIRAIRVMLGHSDSTTTQMYATYSDSTMGETYRAALRRE